MRECACHAACKSGRSPDRKARRRPGATAVALWLCGLACWCEAQRPGAARFRLAAPTARQPDAAQFPAGLAPEMQLIVETFAPRHHSIPSVYMM
jgi:hypothetical protein